MIGKPSIAADCLSSRLIRVWTAAFGRASYSNGTSKSAFAWSQTQRKANPLIDTSSVANPIGKAKGSNSAVTFRFADEFKFHQLGDAAADQSPLALPSTTSATAAELLRYYEQMQLIRRMELEADALYKAKMIRGFCHLQIGQEAVPVGINAAMSPADCLITAYRCHGYALTQGAAIRSILAELLGRQTGVSLGKGGSMHMYAHNFYGGNGIVGAQVPLGVGLAFAQKYRAAAAVAADQQQSAVCENVTFALYGDGAANQGQIFEVYNIAALLRLPVVFVCENNFYGMGTSIERSSASTAYYSRADYIPGIRVNGMDVLAVREAARFAKQWVARQGPILLEMVTYRYGGHSMSDPGTTYRPRDEIQQVRANRDAIALLQKQIIEAGFATEAALKEVDRRVREQVQEASDQAKQDPEPDLSLFYQHVYQPAPDQPKFDLRGCEHDDLHGV